MSAELMTKDITAQAALVGGGEVSAPELVEAAIARLEGARELNVLVHEEFEAARAAASAPGLGGPLAGVPFLLKDLGQPQAGLPEYMGSRALRDHVAAETAWTVERYVAAGLIICGRTNTAEFGNHCETAPALFGRTQNPWKAELSPGGSSGGSAAAVAAGLVGAASGSDGTGSIRMPSSCCGLVGLKPRRGRISFAPSAGQSLDGLSISHALTRTVRDSALLLDVIAGSAPGDPYSTAPPARPFVQEVGADPGPVRVMRLERPPFPGAPDPRIQEVADVAALTLEELGHRVQPGLLSFDPEVMRRSIAVVHAVDNAATFKWLVQELGRRPEPDELDPVTWDMVTEGQELTAVDHVSAIDDLHAQTRLAARAFASADVLLCPTLNVPPPPPGTLSAERGTVDAFFDVEFAATGATAVANVAGWAAITLPLGEVEGLPVGVQLMAPDEAILLRLAAQLEEAMPWSDRHPPGFG
ncbi:MAG TPA: amidase [Solirubrobacteraceae bacterium]|nr:amidase [Solirubrobacteraceae bacterium]